MSPLIACLILLLIAMLQHQRVEAGAYHAIFKSDVQAAEWIALYRNADFPGKCAITSRLILNEGVTIKDPTHECRQIVCGANGVTVFQSCGAISGIPALCRFGDYVNVELPYPQCSYPGRCVVDMGTSVVLLKFAESVKLESLPCTRIFCMGDGWGMLQTCNDIFVPPGCKYVARNSPDTDFPKCCERDVICPK
ncbi:GH10126 [Drosophila grimshawi]|uniref:GH10126 n=1 Tax=Drosophila grimshawi TaxID=7222 RepID=B4JCM0_DROGR|nr:GH10126 [Drosophila grimshawi]